MPKSASYQDFLIKSIQKPQDAAGYIEAILEEKDPEPELLRNALRNVVEAKAKINHLSQTLKQQHEQLDKMLTESGGAEIYTFVEFLDSLGFQVRIVPKEN